jgi:hypothetical protein
MLTPLAIPSTRHESPRLVQGRQSASVRQTASQLTELVAAIFGLTATAKSRFRIN